jgi:hypothetical protein
MCSKAEPFMKGQHGVFLPLNLHLPEQVAVAPQLPRADQAVPEIIGVQLKLLRRLQGAE